MICGQIEVEGDKEIFRPVQMDVAELQTELRVVSFFFSSGQTLLVYKGLVS